MQGSWTFFSWERVHFSFLSEFVEWDELTGICGSKIKTESSRTPSETLRTKNVRALATLKLSLKKQCLIV